MTKKISSRRAFSLIELSIVILIIGLTIIGIVAGKKLVSLSSLSKAKSLTNSSPVNGIEDLVFWVETTSKNSFLNGEGIDNQTISGWNDINPQLTARKNLTQSSASIRPKYIASSLINNLPAVRFNGVDQYLTSATFKNSDLSNQGRMTIFVVMNMTPADGTDMFLYFGDDPNGRIALDSFYWDAAEGIRSGFPNLVTLGNIIFTVQRDSATLYSFVNGAQTGTVANTSFTDSFSSPI